MTETQAPDGDDGPLNLRDLATAASRVGRGRIFRSESPRPETAAALVARLRLRTVVDLRRAAEVDYECADWPGLGVRHVRAPFTSAKGTSWDAPYSAYLEHRPETVVAAVAAIAEGAEQPVLFHCAAGKDRTGVLAAIVLLLLGLDRDAIVADYLRTDRSVAAVLARLRTATPYRAALDGTTDQRHRPRAERIVELLAWLEGAGGAAAWLLGAGLDAEAIDVLRARLLSR